VKAPTVALRKALTAWLQAKLAPDYTGVKVFSSWPQPSMTLPEFAVSVLTVPPFDVQEHEPRIWDTTPTIDPNGTTLYSYGTANVGMQLDVWARYPEARDNLADSVRKWVNRSPIESLGILGALPYLGSHPGLVLKLSDFGDVTAEYRFGQIATPVEDSTAVQSGEWRATWNGSAFLYLISIEQVALMKTLTLDVNGDSYLLT
jgi:hypothetical protein